jgi:SAM-dependent methyltransferase
MWSVPVFAWLWRLLAGLRSRYEGWRDGALDRRYGIETSLFDDAATGTGENAARGEPYEPIQLAVFERIIAALQIEPPAFTFVDYGSGKGRALVLAAERGFRRVIGVEYAAALHEVALLNIARFRERHPGAAPIELYFGDAAQFEPPEEDLLCFFYNPFDDVVMERVLARLEASLRARPRALYLAYRNPVHGGVLRRQRFLRCLAANRSFEIYAAR